MMKVLIVISMIINLLIQNSSANNFEKTENFINSLKHSGRNQPSQKTCETNDDCLTGFFCKNNDCIAKRSEGSLCLSGRNDECKCGNCYLDHKTWNKICLSDSVDGECFNDGLTQYNTCETNQDCPNNYYCDQMDGKVCTSKLAPGRLCFNNEMCSCNRCIEVSHKSRPNKPPITFNICDTC